MNKIEKITTKHVDNWREAQSKAGSLEEGIVNRISYILEFLFNSFDNKLDSWYFEGAQEGEVGDLDHAIVSHMLVVEIGNDCYDKNKYNNIIFIDRNDEEFVFEGWFPIRWLYEDFEQEIIEGKKKYEILQLEKLQKAKIKKEESKIKKQKDKLLAEKAKKKLTKEELAALKKTL